MNPDISILMPVCNVEKYLAKCLDSALGQSFANIEIICINDGSTDSSLSILQEYAGRDDRISIIDKANAGYGAAMNDGLKVARGKYIGILESDDRVCDNAWRTLFDLAEENALDVVRGNYFISKYGTISYFKANQPTNPYCPDTLPMPPIGEVFTAEEYPRCFWTNPSIWTALFRRDFLTENNIWFNETPGASYQDTSFAFKAWVAAGRTMLADIPVIYYTADNEASSCSSKAKVFAVCDEMDECERFLQETGKSGGFFQEALSALRYKTYAWNERRVSEDLRQGFCDRMWNEMCQDFRNGYCTPRLFHEGDLGIIAAHANGTACVSVVLPVYNTAEYLEKCLDSILSQSLSAIEVFCVDDGSDDGSLAVLEDYASRDARIKVRRQAHMGAAAARNLGLDEAAGEYVICLDSDDFFDPVFLEVMYRKAKDEKADIALCNAFTFDNESGTASDNYAVYKERFMGGRKEFSSEDLSRDIFQVASPAPWNKLYRLDFVNENGVRYQNLSNTNDVFFYVAAFACAKKIACEPRRLVYYRVNRSGSLQASSRERDPQAFADALRASMEFLKQREKWYELQGSFFVFMAEVAEHNLASAKTATAFSSAYNAAHEVFGEAAFDPEILQFKYACYYCLGSLVAEEENPQQALLALWHQEGVRKDAYIREANRLAKEVAVLKQRLDKLEKNPKAKKGAPKKKASLARRAYRKVKRAVKGKK